MPVCGGKNLGIECHKEAQEPTLPPNNNQESGSNGTSSNSEGNDGGGGHTGTSNVMIPVAIVLVMHLILAILLILRMWRRRKAQPAEFDVLAKGNVDDQRPVQKIALESNRKEMELPKKGSPNNLSRKGSNSSQLRSLASVDLVVFNSDKGRFGMAEFMKAAAEVLGNGALGSSYKAVISNKLTVVVKRIREMNGKGKDEFDQEMRKLGKLRNTNILTPLLITVEGLRSHWSTNMYQAAACFTYCTVCNSILGFDQ